MEDVGEKELILGFQKNEITEFHIYKALAKITDEKNSKVLEGLSNDEARHYDEWKKYTGEEVKPDKFKIFFYKILSKLFGLTFAIKLMEKGERGAEESYAKVLKKYPEARAILKDEEEHEEALIKMIDEEKVKHIGSMVLGINDALVEITGTLAGLTFALQNTRIVGLAGLITGISATLSMAASEYLSQRSEGKQSALKAAGYTGIAYLMAVIFLVVPFFIWSNPFTALLNTIVDAIVIIFVFTGFTSVVKDTNFKQTFTEMVLISMGVAAVSFIIGLIAGKVLKIQS
ncbi:MAG: rubrerythrin family protein [Candidatus Altiarchaeota archaeon]|nr:rubrerythrin family protein [Candidatus Altiarchaeota archaeon]